MLRIGLFTDTFLPIVDGVGRVVYAYADTLSRMGHRVTVSSPLYDTGYRGGYPFELVDYHAMNVPTARQYKAGAATMDAHYRKRMRMIPLDIAHAHSPFSAGAEAQRIARQRDIPLVATFHSKYYDDFLKATKSESLAQLAVKYIVDFYDKCDEVWAVGAATADVLREYGFKGEIQVMPNGAAIRSAQADALREAESRFSLSGEPVILFVGQINWKKNILRILEAASVLKKEGERFKLVLAGQGPDQEEIVHKADDMGLDGTMILTGHISDCGLLDGLYERAALLAFPSLYDNAPMVVREAAAMGTPAVLVRGSSAADIVREGHNGYLCMDDAEDLARVIKNVLRNPEDARSVGARARDTIPIPWERVLETAVTRYENLIDIGKRGQLPNQIRLRGKSQS